MATWDLSSTTHHVLICNGGSCTRNGGEEVANAIRAELTKAGLDDQIHTSKTRCNGRCKDACVVITYPKGVWMKQLTPEDAHDFVHEFLLKGHNLPGKMSHTMEAGHFKRVDETIEKGIKKSEHVK